MKERYSILDISNCLTASFNIDFGYLIFSYLAFKYEKTFMLPPPVGGGLG